MRTFFTINYMLSVLLMTILFSPIIQACSCFGPSDFCCGLQTAPPDLIVKGYKISDIEHGMELQIEEVIWGIETQDKVMVWGDDGGLCRHYTSSFSTGQSYIFALHKVWPYEIEQAEDYAISICTVTVFELENDVVYSDASWGLTIDGENTEMAYSDFVSLVQTTCNPPINLRLRVFLEGAYDAESGISMQSLLNENDLIPMAQPYQEAPWNSTIEQDVQILSGIFNNYVDWILVELRDESDPNIVVASNVGLLRYNGHVYGLNDARIDCFADSYIPPSNNIEGRGVMFHNIDLNKKYHIVIRHRNHLDVMTKNAISLTEKTMENNNNTYHFDFTQDPTLIMGGSEQLIVLEEGLYALHAGDINGDGNITVADFNAYHAVASSVNVYNSADCNLDNVVTAADFNIFNKNKSTIGSQYIRY